MSKYYRYITERSELDRRVGVGVAVPAGFNELSSSVVSACSFLQSLIQQTIYVTHGAELLVAKKTLKDYPSPKARIQFLCSFPYSEDDPVVSTVFNYSRQLFQDLYDLRNTLAHEIWSSSPEYRGSLLFSSLDEEARLLMTSGRILHTEGATPLEVYNSTIRYIRSVKIVSCSDLHAALKDADLCAWILMHIGNVLDEQDPAQKEEARRAFFVFKGTSHLFDGVTPTLETVRFQSSRSKNIQG